MSVEFRVNCVGESAFFQNLDGTYDIPLLKQKSDFFVTTEPNGFRRNADNQL